MQREELFPRIRARVDDLLHGYLEPPEIVPPRLGTQAGVFGALALAALTVENPGCTPGPEFAS